MLEALHRACLRAGIATNYHDVWGRRVEVAPAQLAALLAEFGFGSHAPDDAPAWEAELAAREAAQWRRALPPVQLVQALVGRGQHQIKPLLDGLLPRNPQHAQRPQQFWNTVPEDSGSLRIDGLHAQIALDQVYHVH